MSATRTIDPKDALNRAMPANARVQLGDVVDDLITKHNALLAKLDADVGVTGTDYVATLKVKTLAERG
jgi:hypothetical protein